MNRLLASHLRCLAVATLVFALVSSSGVALAEDATGGPADEKAWEFPDYGILPKRETGALRFLNEHPQYDGRGVVVAVFDTGVDPGAAGLQTTSDGKPKVVDIVDASGSGDVDTSTVRKAKKGRLHGLTGRKLRIDPDWKNPSGEFHLGMKRAYELFPPRLNARLKRERRKQWDIRQRAALTNARRALADWDEQHPKPTRAQLKQREELATRIEMLKELQKNYDDPGPIFDCVVFHDGERWQAVVDTDEDGDLAEEKLLTNYRDGRQYATFGEEDLLNFSVNIYDQGNLLSIAADITGHGTHVAGIIAAHFPDDPVLNGVAPGAQIVSVKIGDTRLGSNSAGTGVVRGLITVLENQCDLINMSYGGWPIEPNAGRMNELISEIVNKHGVIFVASAGNNGPALSTVGSPGGTTTALLGIGAYVSPAMMEVMYSHREQTYAKVPEMAFHWSSRGPATDGDLGVDLCAPGGAIAAVPPWTLQGQGLKNGTSMSSPNAVGNIALLLSALKAEELDYSPPGIRRALQNTARPVSGSDVFATGRGLIQIDKAHEYLKQNEAAKAEDVRFEVTEILSGGRGVYLRDPHETSRPQRAVVKVDAIFHEDADHRRRVKFHMRLRLESDQPWIEAPEVVVLTHGGRTFALQIDPAELTPGVHYGEVVGRDPAAPERGPLFRVPITVCRAHPSEATESYLWRGCVTLGPGRLQRRFIDVPHGATWADVRLRTGEQDGSRVLIAHATQRRPRWPVSDTGFRKFQRFRPHDDKTFSCPVVGGHTMELCLAQFESSLPEGTVEIEVSFHGLVPDAHRLLHAGGLPSHRVEVESLLRREKLDPKVKLETRRAMIRPQDATIQPLSTERDRLPDERQIHQLILTYELEQAETGTVKPLVSLRENEDPYQFWESQLWMLYDSNKRLVASGIGSEDVKLDKGDYVVRVHIRHPTVRRLEKLQQLPLFIDRPLKSPLRPSVHQRPHDALVGGSQWSGKLLEAGQRAVFYLSPVKAPDDAQPGDLLLGELTLANADDGAGGAGARPEGFEIAYVVPPPENDLPEGPAAADANDKKKPKPKQQIQEEIRDLKLQWLAKLRKKKHRKLYDKLAREIRKQDPRHMPLLVEQLKLADHEEKRKQHLPDVVAAADAIIAEIDTAAMARHYGVMLDEDEPQAKEERKDWDEKKAILIDALLRKAKALMDLQAAADDAAAKPAPPKAERSKKNRKRKKQDGDGSEENPANKPESTDIARELENTLDQLEDWADESNDEFVALRIRRHRRDGKPARALKLLQKQVSKPDVERSQFDQRIELLDELGWEHWRDYERAWKILRYPPDYQPF